MQLLCPGCGVTVATLDGSEPMNGLRSNSVRVGVASRGAAVDSPGPVEPSSVPAGQVLTGAEAFAWLARHGAGALSRLPEGYAFGCEPCGFIRLVSLDDVLELLGGAQADGRRTVSL